MSAKGKDKDKKPAVGDVVDGKWKVLAKLGEGGFGAVYKVVGVSSKEEYAMKVEPVKQTESMLKMEVAVFKTFRTSKLPKPHVCQYIENGNTGTIAYLVMQLVGRSLADLRKACPDGKFNGSTATRLGIQSLEAIEALHKIGFLHRDIKPANFAMGRSGAALRNVFMLDFGLARQYVTRDGQLRPARNVAGFRGTVRYASLNTHMRRDLGRHDDLWSLFYMLVEFHQGQLPWRKDKDKNEVMKKKKETPPEVLLQGMEKEYRQMMKDLDGLKFASAPDYPRHREQLQSIMARRRYSDDDPFDWEEGGTGFQSVMQSAIAPDPYKRKEKADKKVVKEHPEGEEKSGDVEGDGAG